MGKITLLLSCIFLGSCAQRIKVPINRFHTPETIGGGAGVEYQHVGFSYGKLDFTENQTDNPLILSTVSEENFHLKIGPVDKMDIFVDVPKQSSSKIGVKIQLIGEAEKKRAEGHLLAFTMAMGSAQDTFDEEVEIDLKSRLQDYSLIHGYRFSPNLMIYEGISLTTYNFQGEMEDQGQLESDNFEYAASNIFGLYGGVAMGANGFKAKAEIAAQYVEWSHTPGKLLYSFGYSLMAYW